MEEEKDMFFKATLVMTALMFVLIALGVLH